VWNVSTGFSGLVRTGPLRAAVGGVDGDDGAGSRYAIADAELRRAKLALALPLLVAECLAASSLGMVAGARIDVVHLLVCLVYLPLLAMALADAATAYTRRHRMLPAAELGGALLALVPGLPLAVLPAAAHLLRRSEHA